MGNGKKMSTHPQVSLEEQDGSSRNHVDFLSGKEAVVIPLYVLQRADHFNYVV